MAMFFYWLMLRFSKRPFHQRHRTVHWSACVFVWAAYGHMHTWRSKTSQQSWFPPLVSAHKASPWQLRQKSLNMKTEHLSFFFLFLIFVFLLWFLAVTWINFPAIIISNDNNLYSINYLYCTIISLRIDLQQRGAFFFFKVKLSTVSSAAPSVQ